MDKRWVIKDRGEELIIKQLSRELNIDQHLANLLVQRGIHSFDQAKSRSLPAKGHGQSHQPD